MVLTILIIVLGIALAVVYLNREKDEEKARLAILALTAAIVVVAMLRLFLPSRTTPRLTMPLAGSSPIGLPPSRTGERWSLFRQ